MDGDRSRIFSDALRERAEVHGPSGIQSIVISRPDRGVAWSLLAGSSVIYETPFTQQATQSALDPTSSLDWREEGVESIEGIEGMRYRGHYTFPAGAAYELYIEHSTGVRRRSVTLDKTGAQRLTVDWRDVSLESPDPAVFELPQGFSVERV